MAEEASYGSFAAVETVRVWSLSFCFVARSPSARVASTTMTLVTRYRAADGFHTDVPKGIGPLYTSKVASTIIRSPNASFFAASPFVQTNDKNRFESKIPSLRTSSSPKFLDRSSKDFLTVPLSLINVRLAGRRKP